MAKDTNSIRTCNNCKPHPFQDKRYGKGKRVFNKKGGNDGYCCTVCGKDKD